MDRVGAAGLTLTPTEVQRLSDYYELLAKWNKRINLTSLQLDSISDSALDRLLVEPIVSKGLIGVVRGRWFDLGSGGGSPAVPLKILVPEVELTMVESRSRKSAFLREAVRRLDLNRTSVWTGRIEDLGQAFPVGVAQLVTVRAVKVDAALVEVTALLLGRGGQLVTFGPVAPPDISAFPFEHLSSKSLPSGDSAIHAFTRTS
jgi:16S rRNA (guanine(527)-N(7))-methyltransferase GidB